MKTFETTKPNHGLDTHHAVYSKLLKHECWQNNEHLNKSPATKCNVSLCQFVAFSKKQKMSSIISLLFGNDTLVLPKPGNEIMIHVTDEII